MLIDCGFAVKPGTIDFKYQSKFVLVLVSPATTQLNGPSRHC